MRSYRRRFVLASGALVVFACYTVHMDERQIKSIAAHDMACDEALIKLETGNSDDKTVARYTAHGCERSHRYVCQTDGEGRVACHTPTTASNDKSSTEGDDSTASDATGCLCASLFASHSSDPSTTSAPSNPNSTTPQRSR